LLTLFCVPGGDSCLGNKKDPIPPHPEKEKKARRENQPGAKKNRGGFGKEVWRKRPKVLRENF